MPCKDKIISVGISIQIMSNLCPHKFKAWKALLNFHKIIIPCISDVLTNQIIDRGSETDVIADHFWKQTGQTAFTHGVRGTNTPESGFIEEEDTLHSAVHTVGGSALMCDRYVNWITGKFECRKKHTKKTGVSESFSLRLWTCCYIYIMRISWSLFSLWDVIICLNFSKGKYMFNFHSIWPFVNHLAA